MSAARAGPTIGGKEHIDRTDNAGLPAFRADVGAEAALEITHALAHRNELFGSQFGIFDHQLSGLYRAPQIGGKSIFHPPWSSRKKSLTDCWIMFGFGSDSAFELDHLGSEQEGGHHLGNRDETLADRARRQSIEREMSAHLFTFEFDRSRKQGTLVTELIVDRDLGNPGIGGDLFDRGGSEAAVKKMLRGGFDNRTPFDRVERTARTARDAKTCFFWRTAD